MISLAMMCGGDGKFSVKYYCITITTIYKMRINVLTKCCINMSM